MLEPSARRFEPRQVQLFEAMTHPVALAIDAADLYDAQLEDAAVAVAVAQFGQQMIASAHTPELLDRLCQLTTELLGCDASYTYRLDNETDELMVVSHFGDEPEQWEALRVLHCPRAAITELTTVLQRDGLADMPIAPPFDLIPQQIGELMRRMGYTRSLYVPFQRGEEIVAVHQVVRRGSREPFTPKQQRIMRGIAQVAPLALETARLFGELKTANQVKEHFVATLTHELRNPINAISGYHSLLLDDDGVLTDDQKILLERAERCTMELNSLIIATLDLSRFQAARVSIDWQDLSVCDLLNDLSREIQPPADKPSLRLSWNAAPDVGTLYTDPLKLKMALRNLVTNAVKFTERGEVRVEARNRDGGVELRVTDTGIGIPAKALPALFKPFSQAHGIESRRRGGAGLGLHLVKRLLDILGGSIEVESYVGRGSRFQIWLPRDGSRTPERRRSDDHDSTEAAA